jgi:F420-dependent oxidoreductase-like protein
VKLILHLNDFTWQVAPNQYGSTLAEIAWAAEAAGFERIGVADHVWQAPQAGGPEVPELECYTTMAFLAAHTSRAELMAVVTGVHFRNPGLLAKMVTTLDVLSGGRMWLGIGAGHYEEEARGLGIPCPPLAERFDWLDETLQICLRMWSGERGDERPFEGKYFRLERPLNLPQSLRRPHPPILIAGEGAQKTLRLVARYADACSLRPGPQIPEKLAILRQYCEAEGRDYDAIEKTCAFRFDVGEDGARAGELIGQLHWLAGMGVQTVIGAIPNVEQIRPIELVGRTVIPAIADL